MVKEEAREKRKQKIPKAEKKRKIKQTKGRKWFTGFIYIGENQCYWILLLALLYLWNIHMTRFVSVVEEWLPVRKTRMMICQWKSRMRLANPELKPECKRVLIWVKYSTMNNTMYGHMAKHQRAALNNGSWAETYIALTNGRKAHAPQWQNEGSYPRTGYFATRV